MLDTGQDGLVVGSHDREVLGRVGVDEGEGVGQVGRQDDQAGRGERRPQVVLPGERRQLAGHLGLDRVGQARIGRDQQGRGVGAVLRLGEQVGGDVERGGGAVGQDMTSDGPAGRSMPTPPTTSSLAAVTQALPGPTIWSTGRIDSVP